MMPMRNVDVLPRFLALLLALGLALPGPSHALRSLELAEHAGNEEKLAGALHSPTMAGMEEAEIPLGALPDGRPASMVVTATPGESGAAQTTFLEGKVFVGGEPAGGFRAALQEGELILHAISIDREMRHKGVGSLVVNALLEEGMKRGAARFSSSVANPALLKILYQSPLLSDANVGEAGKQVPLGDLYFEHGVEKMAEEFRWESWQVRANLTADPRRRAINRLVRITEKVMGKPLKPAGEVTKVGIFAPTMPSDFLERVLPWVPDSKGVAPKEVLELGNGIGIFSLMLAICVPGIRRIRALEGDEDLFRKSMKVLEQARKEGLILEGVTVEFAWGNFLTEGDEEIGKWLGEANLIHYTAGSSTEQGGIELLLHQGVVNDGQRILVQGADPEPFTLDPKRFDRAAKQPNHPVVLYTRKASAGGAEAGVEEVDVRAWEPKAADVVQTGGGTYLKVPPGGLWIPRETGARWPWLRINMGTHVMGTHVVRLEWPKGRGPRVNAGEALTSAGQQGQKSCVVHKNRPLVVGRLAAGETDQAGEERFALPLTGLDGRHLRLHRKGTGGDLPEEGVLIENLSSSPEGTLVSLEDLNKIREALGVDPIIPPSPAAEPQIFLNVPPDGAVTFLDGTVVEVGVGQRLGAKNEQGDAVAVSLVGPQGEVLGLLTVVVDGASFAEDPRESSRLAVQAVVDFLTKEDPKGFPLADLHDLLRAYINAPHAEKGDALWALRQMIGLALRRAHEVLAEGNLQGAGEEAERFAAVGDVLLVIPGGPGGRGPAVVGSHQGDTRTYRVFRDDAGKVHVQLVTEDHTAGWAAAKERMPGGSFNVLAEIAAQEEGAHAITGHLGEVGQMSPVRETEIQGVPGSSRVVIVEPDPGKPPLHGPVEPRIDSHIFEVLGKGDIVILLSDGISESISPEEIRELAEANLSAADFARRLLEIARANPDNGTAAVIIVRKVPPAAPARSEAEAAKVAGRAGEEKGEGGEADPEKTQPWIPTGEAHPPRRDSGDDFFEGYELMQGPEGIIYRLGVASISQVGKRNEQQDHCRTAPLEKGGETCGHITVLCDGMGGRIDGAGSSRLAGQTFCERLSSSEGFLALAQKYATAPEGKEALRPEIWAGLREAVGYVHEELARTNINDKIEEETNVLVERSEKLRMGTTVAAIVVIGSDAFIISVGDTRVYLLRAGKLVLLTPDHNKAWDDAVKELGGQAAGASLLQIAEAAARQQEGQNILTQSLGDIVRDPTDEERWRSAPLQPHGVIVLALEPGDLLIGTTDGVHGVMSSHALRRAVGGPFRWLRWAIGRVLSSARETPLLQAAACVMRRAWSGRDNRTVALVRYDGPAAGQDEGKEPEVPPIFPVEVPETEFRSFLGRQSLDEVLRRDVTRRLPVINVMEVVPDAETGIKAMKEAGYDGVYLVRPQVPAAVPVDALPVYLGGTWKNDLEGKFVEADGFTVVKDPASARVVITDDLDFDVSRLGPNQFLFRVTAATYREITPALVLHTIQYLVEQKGLQGGAVIEAQSLILLENDRAVLIFV